MPVRTLRMMSIAALATACSQGGLTPHSAEEAYSILHGESGIDSGKSYDDILGEVRALAAKYPNMTEVVEYGSSGEGRKLTAIKIWDKSLKPTGKRPAVLISEAIHGNEYLNITDRLPREFIEGSASGSGFKQLIAKGGIVYMVPIMNPDGYTARKRENAAEKDLNRDFQIKAAGNRGFTQPETRSITDFIAKEVSANNLTLEASMEYHCCIGGFIHPWAYTATPLPADALQRAVEIGKLAQGQFGYPYGTVREIVGYEAIGGSDDYYLETYGRRAFSFEGAQGSEFRNLAKHVSLWNNIFQIAAKDYADVGAGTTVTPPVSSPDLYLAIESEDSGVLKLVGAAPEAWDGLELCMGGRDQCPATGGSGARVATDQFKTASGVRYFRARQQIRMGDGSQVTIIATKGGRADGSSPTRVVKFSKK